MKPIWQVCPSCPKWMADGHLFLMNLYWYIKDRQVRRFLWIYFGRRFGGRP